MMFYIPNLLTLARIGLVPWLVIFLQEHEYSWALAVFIVAGISDGLDGFIAKRFNAQTKLGALLDPIADKALLVCAYVMLSVLELIPFWLMVVVVFRDAVIVGGYLLMVLFFGAVDMQPLRISKLNTVVQISFVVVMLAALAWSLELGIGLMVMSYFVLLTSTASGLAYVYIWSMKAMTDTEPE